MKAASSAHCSERDKISGPRLPVTTGVWSVALYFTRVVFWNCGRNRELTNGLTNPPGIVSRLGDSVPIGDNGWTQQLKLRCASLVRGHQAEMQE
jgi:hypothetical protein